LYGEFADEYEEGLTSLLEEYFITAEVRVGPNEIFDRCWGYCPLYRRSVGDRILGFKGKGIALWIYGNDPLYNVF